MDLGSYVKRRQLPNFDNFYRERDLQRKADASILLQYVTHDKVKKLNYISHQQLGCFNF